MTSQNNETIQNLKNDMVPLAEDAPPNFVSDDANIVPLPGSTSPFDDYAFASERQEKKAIREVDNSYRQSRKATSHFRLLLDAHERKKPQQRLREFATAACIALFIREHKPKRGAQAISEIYNILEYLSSGLRLDAESKEELMRLKMQAGLCKTINDFQLIVPLIFSFYDKNIKMSCRVAKTKFKQNIYRKLSQLREILENFDLNLTGKNGAFVLTDKVISRNISRRVFYSSPAKKEDKTSYGNSPKPNYNQLFAIFTVSFDLPMSADGKPFIRMGPPKTDALIRSIERFADADKQFQTSLGGKDFPSKHKKFCEIVKDTSLRRYLHPEAFAC